MAGCHGTRGMLVTVPSGSRNTSWRGWRASRDTSHLHLATVQPALGKSPPKSTAGRRKASLSSLCEVKFSSAFGRQPEADPFLMPAPWSATPCGSPSCCSTYLTIINILEAPAACFVLDGMCMPRVQGAVWPLFSYW